MSRKSAQLRRKLRSYIEDMEPEVRRAFQESTRGLKDGLVLRRLVEVLGTGDINEAMAVIDVEEGVYRTLHRTIEDAYSGGGSIAAESASSMLSQPGAEVQVRFDVSNPRAEREIRELAGGAIRNITEETRGGVRSIIEAGYAEGRGPNDIARDLIGRTSRATGQRVGGTIGLSRPQSDHVASMRARLSSGNPAEMRKVFGMTRRDRRFDAILRKAIQGGERLSQEQISRMTGRYSDRLLQLRAETIARTETGSAVHKAKHEAFKQGIDKTDYSDQSVTRRWRHSGLHNEDARQHHIAMNNETVQGTYEPFVLPDGTRMMHPLDSSLGAQGDQIINCRCDEEIDIDFSEGVD